MCSAFLCIALFEGPCCVPPPPAPAPTGAGLGLFICRRLVARWGGRLEVRAMGRHRGLEVAFTYPSRGWGVPLRLPPSARRPLGSAPTDLPPFARGADAVHTLCMPYTTIRGSGTCRIDITGTKKWFADIFESENVGFGKCALSPDVKSFSDHSAASSIFMDLLIKPLENGWFANALTISIHCILPCCLFANPEQRCGSRRGWVSPSSLPHRPVCARRNAFPLALGVQFGTQSTHQRLTSPLRAPSTAVPFSEHSRWSRPASVAAFGKAGACSSPRKPALVVCQCPKTSQALGNMLSWMDMEVTLLPGARRGRAYWGGASCGTPPVASGDSWDMIRTLLCLTQTRFLSHRLHMPHLWYYDFLAPVKRCGRHHNLQFVQNCITAPVVLAAERVNPTFNFHSRTLTGRWP